jgi:hypothetical protein
MVGKDGNVIAVLRLYKIVSYISKIMVNKMLGLWIILCHDII